ncbi:MAG: SUMF1/EgtB/PvdO family nonheme iron enzyme [Bryobacteraceae bacterium]
MRTLPTLLLAAALPLYSTDMVWIPSGTVEITDPVTTLRLAVRVSDFLIGATEVTQQEYERELSTNPSLYRGPRRPVENVSWWDAIRYCNLRSIREGLPPCYDLATGELRPNCTGYRLPTETEWIRAAGAAPPQEQRTRFAHLGFANTKSAADFKPFLERGPLDAGSLHPNEFGLYDMRGNVWEWCHDYHDPHPSPATLFDPTGPAQGIARVIRGGSFASTTSRWSRDYRSSMSPGHRSRFTGFRVARSLQDAPRRQAASDADLLSRFQHPPTAFESATGGLSPLPVSDGGADSWHQEAARIAAKWRELLREPVLGRRAPTVRPVAAAPVRDFAGQLSEFETEPGIWERIHVLRPRPAGGQPRPVLIVPYYDVDTPAGVNLGGRNFAGPGIRNFAYMAAQRGYIAVSVRWFGESYGESYSEAVANLALRHPGSTGMGKWVSDARRLVDFIETLPGADPSRIGIIGHSLGGKMALYAAAFEPRITAVVSSEPGIGLGFSNYDDFWYLGDRVHQMPPGTDHHELLALVAPRAFLLIGGDDSDRDESWHYINAVRPVYRLLGKPEAIGYLNHRAGHTPTPESIASAFDWLDHFLKPR